MWCSCYCHWSIINLPLSLCCCSCVHMQHAKTLLSSVKPSLFPISSSHSWLQSQRLISSPSLTHAKKTKHNKPLSAAEMKHTHSHTHCCVYVMLMAESIPETTPWTTHSHQCEEHTALKLSLISSDSRNELKQDVNTWTSPSGKQWHH